MTSRDFCYWLQGFFEITGSNILDSGQVELIKNHLALVFKHEIDPSYGGKDHQKELNEIHNKVTDELNKLNQKIDKVDKKKPVHVRPPAFRC